MTYGGFWRRFAAVMIDFAIVSLFTLCLALIVNSVFGAVFVIKPPVTMGTKERVVLSQEQRANAEGETEQVTEFMERVTYFGTFTYTFRGTEWRSEQSPWTNYKRWLVDPDTLEPIVRFDTTSISIVILLVYWTLAESSGWRGGFGKRWMALAVADETGRQLTLGRALMRNLGKLVSAALLGFGFIMVVWTARKQALHDKVFATIVVDVKGPKGLAFRGLTEGADWARDEERD